MEIYQSYSCERCGVCCKHVDWIDEMKNFDRGDGVCKHLTAKNLCEIYSTRPPLCNGEYVYKKFYSNMTIDEFHLMTRKICENLRGWSIERFHQKISNTGQAEFAGSQEKFNCVAGRGSLPKKI